MGIDAVKLFKALSDRSRLEIMQTLLNGPMYVELLASRLGLTPSTVSFHIKKLEEAGLVVSEREQYYMLYRADGTQLDRSLREMIGTMEGESEQDRREAEYREKVIRAFFEYGKVASLPVQHKKRRIILEEIAKLFEPGRRYTEKEVNLIIADVHDDFCTVRRDFISEGLMTRANGIYTRCAP
jgi:ArsR family transcriptional regulator